MNVFPEPDASTYITPHCEKLDALEDHTLKCLSFFCLTHNFKPCFWNKFASYRQLIFNSMGPNDQWKEILATPQQTKFIHTTEDCGSSLNENKVKLLFTSNPPHQSVSCSTQQIKVLILLFPAVQCRCLQSTDW